MRVGTEKEVIYFVFVCGGVGIMPFCHSYTDPPDWLYPQHHVKQTPALPVSFHLQTANFTRDGNVCSLSLFSKALLAHKDQLFPPPYLLSSAIYGYRHRLCCAF